MIKMHMAIAMGVAAFGILLGLASIFGFILGLVYKRKAAWVTSIFTCLVSMMLVVCMAFFGMQAISRLCSLLASAPQAMSREAERDTAGSDGNMRRWFNDGTDIELPEDAEFITGQDFGDDTVTVYMKLTVPADFQSELDAHLTRSAAMPPELTARFISEIDVVEAMPWWSREVSAPGLIYYTRKPDPTACGGWVTALAFDPNTGAVWIMTDEQTPPER